MMWLFILTDLIEGFLQSLRLCINEIWLKGGDIIKKYHFNFYIVEACPNSLFHTDLHYLNIGHKHMSDGLVLAFLSEYEYILCRTYKRLLCNH